jgi:hypothetical protein
MKTKQTSLRLEQALFDQLSASGNFGQTVTDLTAWQFTIKNLPVLGEQECNFVLQTLNGHVAEGDARNIKFEFEDALAEYGQMYGILENFWQSWTVENCQAILNSSKGFWAVSVFNNEINPEVFFKLSE